MGDAVVFFLPLITIFHFVLPKLLDVTAISAIPTLMLFNLACWSPFYLLPSSGQLFGISTTRFYLVSSWTGNMLCSAIISFVPPLLLSTSLLRPVSYLRMIGTLIPLLTLEEWLRDLRDRVYKVLPNHIKQYLGHPVIATLIQALIIASVSTLLNLTIETSMATTVALILGPRLKIKSNRIGI